jgi:restriction endonuclease Mrr
MEKMKMNDSTNLRKSLKDLAAASSQHTDEILEEELQALLKASPEQLEALRPHVADEATYNRLIAVVEEATQSNEQAAKLKSLLMKGGSKLFNIGKIAGKLLPGV